MTATANLTSPSPTTSTSTSPIRPLQARPQAASGKAFPSCVVPVASRAHRTSSITTSAEESLKTSASPAASNTPTDTTVSQSLLSTTTTMVGPISISPATPPLPSSIATTTTEPLKTLPQT